MNFRFFIFLIGLLFGFYPLSGNAQVNSGSDGHDGALAPTQNITIDMADHPDGVCHYTSVNIPTGVDVTFIRNERNTPVIWLVQNECVINGQIFIYGNWTNAFGNNSGAPGSGYGGNNLASGIGPGSGNSNVNRTGGCASYATLGNGNTPGLIYGNPTLVPLLGGSGGGGSDLGPGGGGGGAILIAANGSIAFNGLIGAWGGWGPSQNSSTGGTGSGGAVRFVAPTISGKGLIKAQGDNQNSHTVFRGGDGRVRFDSFIDLFTGSILGSFTKGSHFGGIPGSALSLSGIVRSTTGAVIPGAIVTVKRYDTVFMQTTTDSSGRYSVFGINADNYTIYITKSEYVTSISNVMGISGGGQSLDFSLEPRLPESSVISINRTPESQCFLPDAPTDPLNSETPRLKVFNGVQFVNDQSTLNPLKPTLILTHGWRSSSDFVEWPRSMASRIWSRLGGNSVNIVAWDWSFQARTFLIPTGQAVSQGERLGKALLQSSLGINYSQHIHFIGHSLGTIVNAEACEYVHGTSLGQASNPEAYWRISNTNPHITLLDEAGIAFILGNNVVLSSEISSQLAEISGPITDGMVPKHKNWRSPLPNNFAWADNYISEVGRPHQTAVNVFLTKSSLNTLISHKYAYLWYEDTIILNDSPAPIGFDSSYESGNVFPPTGVGRSPNSHWIENLETSAPLDLILNNDLTSIGAASANSYILKPARKISNNIIGSYGVGIEFAKTVNENVIYSVGNVISSSTEKMGNWWDAASDKAANLINHLNPDVVIPYRLNAAVFGIRLRTQPFPQARIQTAKALDHSNLDLNHSGQPAYAWISVKVPIDAGMMAFDFMVTGEPVEDKIVCAINEQNVFSLAAKYSPSGEPQSTDMFDVSAYAGQTIELFFGLAGGSSTDCELAIDGVRFITIPPPPLVVAVTGDQVRLSWPAAATGWKPEMSESLEPGSWHDVPNLNTVAIDQGIVTLLQPKTVSKQFYRLSRDE